MKTILALFFLLVSPIIVNAQSSAWTAEVINVAHATEVKYHLPHGIAAAFNLQENSGRIITAFPRVESGFFNIGERHYKLVFDMTTKFFKDNPELIDSIPFDVERFQEASSWGPFQLLGTNIRALGCKKKFLSEITWKEHFELWGKFFAGYLKQYKTLNRAISMYNGPKAPVSYLKNVLRWQSQYSW